METLLQKLLDYYKLSEENFAILSKPIEEISLKNPDKIKGMKEAKNRIFEAIKNKEKIIIYGDYDCDGISATSILVKTFEKLNYPVNYYIPSRYNDGYGLNVNNVIKIAKSDYKLIICVDNGISQFDAISKAKELGIDVIVVDHHEVSDKQVDALAILHPIVSEISTIIASGGYMSLFLSAGLLGYYDDYLVTIAGLSVISDLMELKDYNRDVVRLAIHNFQKNQYLPLKLLLESPIITEKSFSLDIAPKINAVGRMLKDNKTNLLVKYLTSDDKETVLKLRDFICEINEERKEQTKLAVEAIQDDLSSLPGIILILDIKEGLVGLIANRLLNQYNVPSLVFTYDEKDPQILIGSIRSKVGFNVSKAFQSLNKYLLTGGGHALAGGLSIKKEDFPSFKKDFIELCQNYPLIKQEKNLIKIDVKDISFDNYNLIRKFAPFGMGFEEPTFVIENLPTRSLQFISFGKHLSTQLTIRSKLLGFNMPEKEIKSHTFIDIYGNFNLSSFRNAETLEFRISEFVSK